MTSATSVGQEETTKQRRIRVLALMEGAYITGPAKNLIQIGSFGKTAQTGTALDLTVGTYGRAGWVPEPLLEGLDAAAIPYELIQERRRFDPSAISQIRALVAKYKPDIIQTHMVKSHFLLRASGLYKTHRWLAFHHGYTKVDKKTELYNQLDRWSLRTAHQIVAVCGPFVEQLVERGIPRKRIAIQHNSVPAFVRPEEGELQALRSRLKLTGAETVFLGVGRLSAEKGYADLVEATAIVARDRSDFRLVILGEGPERPRLEAAIARHGLENVVTLAGHSDRVAPFFGIASIQVVSSHSEGSPNVLLEAMAAGLPVVATSVGGIPEIVQDSNTALLVPAHSPEKLANAMSELLRNPAQAAALGREALSQAGTRYSVAAHYASLTRVYDRLYPHTTPLYTTPLSQP